METFAVSKNGAVWKCHDRFIDALEQATFVAKNEPTHQWYQGFDDSGKSAVVSKPVVVRVERLKNNKLQEVMREWVAGVPVRAEGRANG